MFNIIIFIISLSFCLPYLFIDIGGDERLFIYQAYMINNNVYPVGDYFSKDAPYFLFIWAIIIKFFGTNILVLRLVGYCVNYLLLFFLYKIVMSMYDNKYIGYFAVALTSLSLFYIYEGSPLYAVGHQFIAAMFIFAALYVLVSDTIVDNQKYFLCNFLFMTAILCRQTFIFSYVALALYYIFYIKISLKNILYATAGIVISAIPYIIFCILFGYKIAIYSAWFSTELFNFGFYEFHRYSEFYFVNVILDFLKAYNGQNLLLAFLFLISFYYKDQEVKNKNTKNILLILIFSMVFGTIFFSKHGYTWHYFAILVPMVVIYFINIYKRPNFFIIIITLIYMLIPFYKMAQINLNSVNPLSLKNTYQISDRIKNCKSSNYNLYTDNQLLYIFSDSSIPHNKFINSSWLEQLNLVSFESVNSDIFYDLKKYFIAIKPISLFFYGFKFDIIAIANKNNLPSFIDYINDDGYCFLNNVNNYSLILKDEYCECFKKN